MFPNEIVEILIKYQNDNNELLSEINDNISTIIENLYSVNQNLAEQIKELILDKDTNNNVEEIMQDSIMLRNYIKSVQLLDIENIVPDETFIEASEELIPPTFEKKVYPYLVADDICPFCNYKMSRHLVHYQRIVNSQLKNEDVMWNRCPACKRLFEIGRAHV